MKENISKLKKDSIETETILILTLLLTDQKFDLLFKHKTEVHKTFKKDFQYSIEEKLKALKETRISISKNFQFLASKDSDLKK